MSAGFDRYDSRRLRVQLLAIGVAVILLFGGVALVSAAPKKLPLPDKATREAKRNEVLAIFPVAQAKSFDEKGQLAAQLIRTASETDDDPAAVFALLNLAREQAAEAGHIQLAFDATDKLAEIFEFDPAEVRLASLQQAARAQLPSAAKRDVVIAGMDLIDQLVASGDFDDAKTLSERMLTLARPLRDAELVTSLNNQIRSIENVATTQRDAQTALATLKRSPDDTAANLAVGKYLAFVKKDWEAGVAHLAKGSDALLATAAKGELAAPIETADREKLADAWWAAADAQPDAAIANECRAQAVYWYREIAGEVVGLAKAKVERRLAEAKVEPAAHGVGGGQPQIVYLDDLVETSSRVGFGTLGKHGADVEGKRRNTVDGEIPAHALAADPPANGFSQITYALDGKFERFEAWAGLWNWSHSTVAGSRSPLTFRVVGDDKVLWEAGPFQKKGTGKACSISVRGVRKLSLQVHCAGAADYAAAVWAEPRLEQAAATRPAPAVRAIIHKKAFKFGGHHYLLVLTPVSRAEAEAACASVGGHLVRIESEEEQRFVQRLVPRNVDIGDNIWIDGSDAEEEGTWRFSNGQPMNYLNWSGKEPNNDNGGEHAATMHNIPRLNFTWNDVPASTAYCYFCEWDE